MTIQDYGKNFFKKKYYIAVALITLFFTSFFVFDAKYGFLSLLNANKMLKPLALSVCAVLLLTAVFFILIRNNEKENSFLYSVSFSLVLTGIISTIYIAIIGNFSVLRLMLNLVILLIGFLFIAFKMLSLKKNISIKKDNKLIRYIREVLDKFNFYFVIFFALFLFASFSLIYRGRHPYGFDLIKYALLCLFAVSFIIYVVFSLKQRSVKLFDAIMLSSIYSAIFVLLNVIFVRVENKKFLLCLGVFLIIISALLGIIILRINNLYSVKTEKKIVADSYLKKFNEKYGIIAPIFIGLLLSVFTMILFRYSIFRYYFNTKNASLYAIPYVLINFFSYCTLVVGEIYALCVINKKEIGKGDFALITSLTYTVFSLVSLISQFTLYGLIILSVALVYTVILLCFRIKIVTENK